MTASTSGQGTRVYYPKNRTTLLICGAVNVLIAAYLLSTTITRIGASAEPLQLSDFSVLIPLVAGLACLGLALSSKMIVTPEALIFHQLGLRAHTPWSNLVRLGPPLRGPQSVAVLHLRAPAVIDWVWLAAGYREEITGLPLIGYAHAAGTSLRADLERHAPQLFG